MTEKLKREDHYLKGSEAAAILGVDMDTLYELCESKAIPSFKVGEKAIRIPRAAFDIYLAKQQSDEKGA